MAPRVAPAGRAVVAPASTPGPIRATVAAVATGARSMASARQERAPVSEAPVRPMTRPVAPPVPRDPVSAAARERPTPAPVRRRGLSNPARQERWPAWGRAVRPAARPARPVTPARGPVCGSSGVGLPPATIAQPSNVKLSYIIAAGPRQRACPRGVRAGEAWARAGGAGRGGQDAGRPSRFVARYRYDDSITPYHLSRHLIDPLQPALLYSQAARKAW